MPVPPGGMSIAEAIEHTGVPKRTLHRRAEAWETGDRTSYAIRSWRLYAGGPRRLDRADVERVRMQRLGRLDPTITADEFSSAHPQDPDPPRS